MWCPWSAFHLCCWHLQLMKKLFTALCSTVWKVWKRSFSTANLSSLVLKFKLFYFASFSYPGHLGNPAVLDQGGSNITSFHDFLSSHPIAESGTACDWSPIHLLQGIQSTCLYLNSNSKEYSNTFLGSKEVPLAFSTMSLPLAKLWLGELRTQRTRDGFPSRKK